MRSTASMHNSRIRVQKLFVFTASLALLLQGCTSAPSLWGDNQFPTSNLSTLFPTETPLPTYTPPPTETFTPSPTSAPTDTPTITLVPTVESPVARIKHVIIISYDGMRGDAVAAAPMPNLMAMMREGAYTTTARTINYSVTLPAHASMLSGLCQSKHGVDWNATTYYKGYSKGVDIFDEAQDRKSTRLNSSHAIPSRMPSSA